MVIATVISLDSVKIATRARSIVDRFLATGYDAISMRVPEMDETREFVRIPPRDDESPEQIRLQRDQ
jgi:hypothetical protein